MEVILFICVVAVLLVLLVNKRRSKPKAFKEFLDVPRVSWCLPYFGHGLSFSKDIIGYIKKCRQQYGDVFHVKIFLKNVCIVCDKTLVKEFFQNQETSMSMYDNLKAIYFDYAFSDDGNQLDQIIHTLNQTIAVKFDDFLPKIVDEANSMSKKIAGKMELTPITIGFVSKTSARCFLGISLDNEISQILSEFTDLLNRVTSLTYFFPKLLIRKTIGRSLDAKRKEFNKLIQKYITPYRHDPNKKESLIFRYCVDAKPALSDEEICNTILCLLYVSSENTALGLNATLIDLLRNPVYMAKVRAEIMASIDDKELIRSQSNLLHAAVLESSRMNSHVFAITRATKRSSTLGKYYVGNVDYIALCEPLLMTYPEASDTFENPTKYYPDRYLKNPSLKIPENVMTWGAGPHLCPGKMFAIYEIKTAVMTLLRQYHITVDKIPPINYFSPSAYGDMTNTTVNIQPNIFRKNNIIVEKIGNGYLLRNYLSEQEQVEYYQHIIDVSKDSSEHQKILNEPTSRAFPICMWNNVYTGESNCKCPQKMLDLGDQILSKFPEFAPITSVDSVYAQLFGVDASMSAHYDEHVDWGISINLGASVLFTFGQTDNKPNYVVLNSGDVFIGDFSKNLHSVELVLDNTPSWFKNSCVFGRTRCSIQLRNLSLVTNNKITNQQFFELLKSHY